MSEIDGPFLEQLLRKYAEHVGDIEGTDFLEDEARFQDSDFTREEWDILQKVVKGND
jgi:hypothetical protein